MPRKKRLLHKSIEVFQFADDRAWLGWLERNHEQPEAIWIMLAKKNSGVRSITYEEAREGAIRYGWIDGLMNSWDEKFYLIRFSQRRTRSKWSKINRDIALQLIKDGRMMPAGQAQVDAAKKDGRWQAAYSSQARIAVPAELKQRFRKSPKAKKFFESLSSVDRYAFLYRIESAAKKETRQRWIDRTLEMLEAGKSFNRQIRKKK